MPTIKTIQDVDQTCSYGVPSLQSTGARGLVKKKKKKHQHPTKTEPSEAGELLGPRQVTELKVAVNGPAAVVVRGRVLTHRGHDVVETAQRRDGHGRRDGLRRRLQSQLQQPLLT